MRGILTIAGKDLRSLFYSPLFWVISFLLTGVWSVLYQVSLGTFARNATMMQMQGQESSMSLHEHVFAQHVGLVNFLMILAVVALTMRLFAEEKKNRTFDLLLTSPVTATQIVAGKYLAGLLASWTLVGISLLYPLATMFLADFDLGPLMASYLGLLLLVACYVAVGMFASSLTESTVLAVVMGLIFSVGIWFIGALSEAVEQPFWVTVFEHLSVGKHFSFFIRGGVGVASIVFFLSVVFINCFLTQRVVESSRWR
ncbi:MAG: ABC transporter permease subunit [Bdellovibrionaceae bacterium]|nr:ABC transporter permease subunit [Pseudobdellovibrionaceae bacterium]